MEHHGDSTTGSSGSKEGDNDSNNSAPSATRTSSRHGDRMVPSIFTNNQSLTSSSNRPASRADDTSDAASTSTATAAATATPTGSVARQRTSSIGAASASTDGPMSPSATDRVFPIRSFVSVDPTPTPGAMSDTSRDSVGGYFGSRRTTGSRKSTSTERAMIPEEEQPETSASQADSAYEAGEESTAESVSSRRDLASRSTRFHVPQGDQALHVTADAGSSRSNSFAGSLARVGSARPRSRQSGYSEDNNNNNNGGGLLTARFKHVVTDGGHHVITGRDGETLQRCEDEPIHIPGAVQSFGALVALKEEAEGKLVVRVASENSHRILGFSPKQLFELSSFTDILSDEQADNLLDHIDFIKDEAAAVEADGPEVFTLSVRSGARRRSARLWCAMHMNDKNPDLVICEFELEDDRDNPLVPASDSTPEPPEDTLSSDPTAEELRESTEARNRPLRVLRSARKRKGEAAAMEVFNIMSQVQEQLAEAPNLQDFLRVLVGVVKELTGFHRVMVYQFDQAWNGKVVTELVDPRATKDLYKGLHFPASDIPSQARDLYRVNKVRLLYDRDQETARLVCRTLHDLERPLDLTYAYLRAMSPIHIKYLANMAVRSSMSISINAFDELWGLISCHAYGPRGTRVSFPIRKMCRLVGDSASRNIERISYATRLQARKLINTAPTKRNPSGYIIASSDDLLSLFDADFGLLSIHDETKILGKLEATQEALAMLEYLRLRRFASVTMTQDIKAEFPDLRYPPGFQVIAGLLLVPLTARGDDFIVFFRKGQLKEVRWAGNPYEKFVKEGTEGYLEPRKSFKTWSETIVGRCREWTEEEIETAAVLCLVYGKFIEVWRQKEAALQNTQLTKLLLANSAHEVRTPLNAIINYLEIALEGSLDQETRDNLAKSHSASKSLIYVINDLLDLTKTEASEQLVHEEKFDVAATFREAMDVFRGDARRKAIALDVVVHPNVPPEVLGDQRRVRQAVSNIAANAIQATSRGGVTSEIGLCGDDDDDDGSNRNNNNNKNNGGRRRRRVVVEIAIEDSGAGMDPAKLDALFAELEQAQTESDALIEETIAPNARSMISGGGGSNKEQERTNTLGLGLAVVSRIIRNMGGQLRVKSEPGVGSRFVMQLPFDLPESAQAPVLEAPPDPTSQQQQQQQQQQPEQHAREGGLASGESPAKEVTLVARHDDATTSGRRASSQSSGEAEARLSLSRRESSDSVHSKRSVTGSMKSGQSFASFSSGKSEADRLIEAIQEPRTPGGTISTSRSNSASARDRQRHRVSWDEDPPHARRSLSHEMAAATPKTPKHKRESRPLTPGKVDVASSNAPLRAIRMPDDPFSTTQATTTTTTTTTTNAGGVGEPASQELEPSAKPPDKTQRFRVLVAEDDPINSKIVQKRLQKLGHDTHLTVNGEECASTFGDRCDDFDVVLMDMQMPIVDGLSSTKMIRSFEKSNPSRRRSRCAAVNGRIPIIAVSASLQEKDRAPCQEAGFDAWILKPINFNRLVELMAAIEDEQVRRSVLYQPGKWEQGGWFHLDASHDDQADTKPSERQPFADAARLADEGRTEVQREESQPEIHAADRQEAVSEQPSTETAQEPAVS